VIANGPGERPGSAPPLWTSADGTTWTPLSSPSWNAALTGYGVSVVSGPTGVVATTLGTDPVVLHSADGSTWTRATLPATVQAIAQDVVAHAGGFLIVGRDGQPDHFSQAVENSQSPPGVGRPAAWISPDGTHWSEANVEGSTVAGAGLRQVGVTGTGFLAVGINSTADFYDVSMTTWTSADGRTWSITTGARLPAGAGAYPVFASHGGPALLFGRVPGESTPAAWILSGEMTWTPLTFVGGPLGDCSTDAGCLGIQRAWTVPGGVIVLGAPNSGFNVAQTFWFGTGS
jgi:hypothetical protein